MKARDLMITFWSECTHHSQSIKMIYNEMVRRGRKVAWKISRRPPKKGNFVTSSAHVAWAQGKPHNRIIYLNHSLDRHELSRDYPLARKFKAVMFPGVWWQKRMKNPPLNVVIGWPKSDILFKVNVDRLRKRIGIPKGKTLYYASSYTYRSNKMVVNQIKNAKALFKNARKVGFMTLVKLHPGMLPENFNLAKRAMGKERAVYILSRNFGNSMIPFPISNVLASETSGLLAEFLATNKPSIQFSASVKHRCPGGVFNVKVENMNKILSNLKPHPEAKKWRNLLMGKVDGKASERAANFIEKVFS